VPFGVSPVTLGDGEWVKRSGELAEELDCTVLLVHSREPRRHTFLQYLLEQFAF